jgi:hypothetical protein
VGASLPFKRACAWMGERISVVCMWCVGGYPPPSPTPASPSYIIGASNAARPQGHAVDWLDFGARPQGLSLLLGAFSCCHAAAVWVGWSNECERRERGDASRQASVSALVGWSLGGLCVWRNGKAVQTIAVHQGVQIAFVAYTKEIRACMNVKKNLGEASPPP